MERKIYLALTSLDEARALWFEKAGKTSPLTVEAVPLAEAQGRVLALPAVAALSSPAFHGAAMDGIAVLAKDTYGASESTPLTLINGKTAHWINTGHPLPEGTNAVIMTEKLVCDPPVLAGEEPAPGQTIIIEQAAFPWQHVRKLGEDIVATEILLPPGTPVGPYELGALAAAGVLMPQVYRKPTVAIIPSGSELVPLHEATEELLASGKALPEFNSLILAAMVRDAGGEPHVLPIVPDSPAEIAGVISGAVEKGFDLVVINAGSSAGSHDYTAEIIEKLGELYVHGVTIMPGKPTALGRVGDTPVIGVPGYPVSAILAFEEFGQSLLARWQGRAMPKRPQAQALPFNAIPSKPGMEERVRVKLGQVDDALIAVPLPRGAGTVTSLSRADGIISIPDNSEGLAAGQAVPVTIIHPEAQIRGALLAIGSHDNTLDLLDSFLRKADAKYSLTSAHVGSLGGLMALQAGKCHLAGTHLLDSDSGIYNQASIRETLAGIPVKLVRLVDREQGLIVRPGNPLGIHSLADLAREEVTFINRQRGSGTRVLLDWQLVQLGISPDRVSGYEEVEYTHMNVAAAVLSGRAATGLGVRSAANALGLDFLPVGVEEYDLAIPERHWNLPQMQALLAVVRSEEFQKTVFAMGGYGIDRTGEIVMEFF